MVNTHIIHVEPVRNDIISIEQFQVKKARRRKRVAKRMALRFPLFAVEFMQDEFQGYTYEEFEKDIEGKKRPKYKKGKSPLPRYGRYQLMRKALLQYGLTKDLKYLAEAQRWRRQMYKRYELEYRLAGEAVRYTFPPTIPIDRMKELTQINFENWEDLDKQIEDKLKYVRC